MKLLQINAVYGEGSTGYIVKYIDEYARANGIDSYIAYSQSKTKPVQGYKIGNILDRKIHAVLSRISGKQAYFSLCATLGLIRYIDKIHPDIVHLHNVHGSFVRLKTLLNYLSKIKCKVVITQHDCWFYTGNCFHYTETGCFKWQNGCKNCPERYTNTPAYLWDGSKRVWNDKKKLFAKIEDLTVVSVSNWLTGETEKSLLSDKNLVTIHNGIDTNVFTPTPSNFKSEHNIDDKFVILGMANKWLSPCNDGALEKILSKLDENFVIVLVGCNEMQQSQKIDRVIKLGFISSQEELAKIYSMADVFVNLTHEDTLSSVNLEAQACGTPLITYRITGTAETVDENFGYGIELNDIDGIINGILKIKKNTKDFYSEKCRNFVVDNFEKNKKYEEYISLYKKLTNTDK